MTTVDVLLHRAMLRRCDGIVEKLRGQWDKEMTAYVAMTWVAEPIQDDEGKSINDKVILELPNNKEEWWPLLIKLITRTKAFGLLLVQFQHDTAKVIFESPFGSRSWSMHLERHGDTKTLSRPTVLDDVESIGLLWNKKQAIA